MTTTNGIGTNSTGAANGAGPAADLNSGRLLSEDLSAADLQTRGNIVSDAGPDALNGSAGVDVNEKMAMTPSQFWPAKLGECHSKGISIADCTPWS